VICSDRDAFEMKVLFGCWEEIEVKMLTAIHSYRNQRPRFSSHREASQPEIKPGILCKLTAARLQIEDLDIKPQEGKLFSDSLDQSIRRLDTSVANHSLE
jgi:hypothetical protein